MSASSDGKDLTEPLLYTPRVIYNRVPKCGSETVRHVIGVLSDRGRFNIMSSIIYHDYNVTHSEQVMGTDNAVCMYRVQDKTSN